MEEERKEYRKAYWKGVGSAALFVLVVGLMALVGMQLYRGIERIQQTQYPDTIALESNEEKLDLLMNIVEQMNLSEVGEDELYEGAFRGLMEALDDPYSCYYTKEEYAAMIGADKYAADAMDTVLYAEEIFGEKSLRA